MNLKQFKYVQMLATAGSFAKAADLLGISQPSLSQYIKKIEQQLDVELFSRAGGTLRLTDAGRVYLEAGSKILNLEHQMLGQLNDLAAHKDGTIVIGTSPYRSASMMPAIAKRFQMQYPGMHLVVEEMTSQELTEAASRGQFDLCLTMLPANDRLFQWEKVAEEELILAVPAGAAHFATMQMPGRKYPAIDAAALDQQSFVMITQGQFMQRSLDNLALDYGLTLRKAAVVKSLEAQIAMVRAGIGMALLPSGIERFCTLDEVRFYSLQQELPKREVVIMWQKEQQLNQAVKDLLGIMKEISW